MKRETRNLIFIFLGAFFIRILFALVFPVKSWDETVYANLGYNLAHNFFDYSFNHGWSDYIPFSHGLYSFPNAGFRAPLLPVFLSFFYFLKLDFLVPFFIPFVGALSAILIYFLGKSLFNKKAGFYSSIFLAILPLHVIYSGRILTGILFTFFILLTFLSFWKGFEKDDKKYKLFFGFFFALALLSRYTALWVAPVFLIYLLVRDKSLKFLRDKGLWESIGIFFLVLVPWFIYGKIHYGNFLGAFIHGAKAAAYWGGVQEWFFFFSNWNQMFSLIGLVFIASLIYIVYKKKFFYSEVYLILIWFIVFLGIAILMPHKEDRFILAITPTICLLSGFFMSKLKGRKLFVLIVIASLILLLFSLLNFYKEYNSDSDKCFLEANNFLGSVEANSLIVTDQSSVVYFYTHKETNYFPNPWDMYVIEGYSLGDVPVYLFFTDYDFDLDSDEDFLIKKSLDENFDNVFECSLGGNYSTIYRLN